MSTRRDLIYSDKRQYYNPAQHLEVGKQSIPLNSDATRTRKPKPKVFLRLSNHGSTVEFFIAF